MTEREFCFEQAELYYAFAQRTDDPAYEQTLLGYAIRYLQEADEASLTEWMHVGVDCPDCDY